MELSEFSELFGVSCGNCVKILNILTILKMVGGGEGVKRVFWKRGTKSPQAWRSHIWAHARKKNQVRVTKFAHEDIYI